MDAAQIESLIPYRDTLSNQGEKDARAEHEKRQGNYFLNEEILASNVCMLIKIRFWLSAGDAYRSALEDHTEVAQHLTQRNRQLREVIDQMRTIIWEINTMLAMRQT